MEKKYPFLLFIILFSLNQRFYAQCAVSSAPTNDCTYGDGIQGFTLNAIAATGNSGCGASGYNAFSSPVWTLQLGTVYNWSAAVGSGVYSEGVGIWIDYNNDGFYATSEFVSSGAPSSNVSGTLSIPYTAFTGTVVNMRVRDAYNSAVTSTQACVNGIGFGYGETEDYKVYLSCPSSIAAPTVTNATPVVCAGNTLVLNASALSTFTWSGGITNNVAFTPTATLAYTVTTNVPSCPTISNTAVTNITVNALPVVTGVSSGSICPGFSFVVTPSGASTYSYISATATISGASASFQPISLTTYTVRGTSAAGCVSQLSLSPVFSVTPLSSPTRVVSAPSLSTCPGISNTISVTGASTYTWNGLSTGTSIVTSPTTTSAYTIVGTAVNGCTASSLFSLFAFQTPTVTINSGTICSGYNFTLIPSGANTYTINGASGTLTSNIVSPFANSNYTVTGSSAQGCLSTASLAPVSSVIVNASPTITALSGSICVGRSFSLSPSGSNNTYSVNGISLGSNTLGVFSPVVSTTYSVSGTNTNGCVSFSPAIANITVVPLPTVTAVSSASFICINQGTATLTGNGASTYSWSTGATNSLVSVSPTVNTVYQVTGTSSLLCSNIATVAVNVWQLPQVIVSASPNFICAGASTTLSAIGANSYSWSSGSTNSNVVVSPSVSSIYSVTGTDLNACKQTATLSVAVNTLVITVLPNSTSICAGSSITFTASGAAANTYSWNGASGFNTYSASPGVGSTYTVTAIDPNNCLQSVVATVSVNALPTVLASTSRTLICLGETATISASGASTYSWSSGVSGASIVVSPTIDLTYNFTVVGTDANNCSSSASQSIAVSKCTAINVSSADAGYWSVYPNPGAGIYNIDLGNNTLKQIEVIDLTGRIILSDKTSNDKYILNINAYPKGIYYLKLNSDHSSKTIKLIKE